MTETSVFLRLFTCKLFLVENGALTESRPAACTPPPNRLCVSSAGAAEQNSPQIWAAQRSLLVEHAKDAPASHLLRISALNTLAASTGCCCCMPGVHSRCCASLCCLGPLPSRLAIPRAGNLMARICGAVALDLLGGAEELTQLEGIQRLGQRCSLLPLLACRSTPLDASRT
jgi:hypothetical protein